MCWTSTGSARKTFEFKLIQAMEPDVAGAAFLAGRIDAAVTWEPWLSKARTRPGGKVLLTSADVPGIIVDVVTVRDGFAKASADVPGIIVDVVTVRDGFAKAHPGAVKGLIQA